MTRRRLDQLERLGRLRQSGVLTPIEYEAEKRRLLERGGGGVGLLPVILIGLLGLTGIGYLAVQYIPHWAGEERRQPPRSPANPPSKPPAPTGLRPTPGRSRPPAFPNLDKVLAFSRPRACGFGPRLASVYEAMARWSDEADKMVGDKVISVPELRTSFRAKFSRTPDPDGTVEYMASLPLKGTWHGLRVKGLSTGGFERSDQFSWAIEFDEPASRVRDALDEHNFDLAAVGSYRPVPEGERTSAVVRHGAGAALICTPNL